VAHVERIQRVYYLLGNKRVNSGTPEAKKVLETSKDYYAVLKTLEGKRVRVCLKGITTKAQAEEALKNLLKELKKEDKRLSDLSDTELDILLKSYHSKLINKGLAIQTITDEMSKVREMLLETLYVIRLEDIDISKIQEELQKKVTRQKGRKQKPLSARTKNFYIGALIRFGKWLKLEKHWKKNLFKKLELFRGAKKKVRRYMTSEELKAIVQAAKTRGRNAEERKQGEERALFYLFLFYTLTRAESSRSVTVGQLNFRKNPPELVLRGDQVKNKKTVTKVLHPRLVIELQRWIAAKKLKAEDTVFTTITKWVVTQFNRDLKAAGIPKNLPDGTSLDIHSFKTSAISILHDAGVPLKVIQELAEHSNPQTTMNHYVKANKVTLAQAFLHLPELD
jgi:integrase